MSSTARVWMCWSRSWLAKRMSIDFLIDPMKILSRPMHKSLYSITRAFVIAKNIESNSQKETHTDHVNMKKIKIDTTDECKYRHSFYVPRAFHGFFAGDKVRKKLEEETETLIEIPERCAQRQDIVITGAERSNVESCRDKINHIITSSREKIPYTHFVSIPLNTERIIERFEKFKANILNDAEHTSNGIVQDIFVNSRKLHLTIGMLRLLDDDEKKEAVDIFNDCVNELIKPILEKTDRIVLNIQGLGCMNDNFAKVSVLYGKVSENSTLQEVADRTREFFVQRGLMTVERSESVKLHMTLMKTSRLKKKSKRKCSRLRNFDARKIIEDHKEYFFGDTTLNTIHISEMIAVSDDGHYKPLVIKDLYE